MPNKEDLLNANDFEEETELDNADDKAKSNEDEEEKSKTDEVKEEKVKTQTETEAERNARFAEKRRKEEEAKRETKIREEAKLEAELGVLKTNPFTNEPIVDKEDLEIYKIQKELDENGKDPINDLPKKLAEINRKKRLEETKKQQESDEAQRRIAEDIADFRKTHPNVNLSELAKDKEYLEFADGKVGRWTTAEIYEAYTTRKEKLAREQETKKDNKVVDDAAKKVTKTPSSTSNGKTSVDKAIKELSDDEFESYWNNL